MKNSENSLKNVICTQCEKSFKLRWENWENEKQSLFIRICPSGGIYDVYIECPHCDYQEDL